MNNVTIGAGTLNANTSEFGIYTHLYLDGSGASYVGGSNGDKIFQSLYVLNNASVSSGGGYFNVGYQTISQGTLDLSRTTRVWYEGTNGSVAINSGTYRAPSTTVFNGTSWTYNGAATYHHGHGIVYFLGGNQSIVGPMRFYNFYKSNSSGTNQTLTLPASTTVIVENYIYLYGNNSTALLLLRSSTAGTQAQLDVRGTRTLQYLDVKDNNNVNATAMGAVNSVDSGNNTNWTF